MKQADILIRQYGAVIDMLDETVQRCPDELWLDQLPVYPFWRLAYHAAFYTHLYSSDTAESFVPWEHLKTDLADPDHELGKDDEPCTKEDVAAYNRFIVEHVRSAIPRQDLDGPSGIPWWNQFNKMEMHIYNIRHTQHHVGQLVDRLRNETGMDVKWIGSV